MTHCRFDTPVRPHKPKIIRVSINSRAQIKFCFFSTFRFFPTAVTGSTPSVYDECPFENRVRSPIGFDISFNSEIFEYSPAGAYRVRHYSGKNDRSRRFCLKTIAGRQQPLITNRKSTGRRPAPTEFKFPPLSQNCLHI